MLNDAKASPLLHDTISSVNVVDRKKDAIAKKEDQSFRQEVAQMEQKVAKMLNEDDDRKEEPDADYMKAKVTNLQD